MAFSIGASTAILTAAHDPRIEALVLDSPFATMSGVIAANYRRYQLPGGLLLPVADLVNRIFCGYAFEQVRPVDAMSSLELIELVRTSPEKYIEKYDVECFHAFLIGYMLRDKTKISDERILTDFYHWLQKRYIIYDNRRWSGILLCIAFFIELL